MGGLRSHQTTFTIVFSLRLVHDLFFLFEWSTEEVCSLRSPPFARCGFSVLHLLVNLSSGSERRDEWICRQVIASPATLRTHQHWSE